MATTAMPPLPIRRVPTNHIHQTNHVQSISEIKGDFPLDEAVLELLPKGTTVIAADSYGTSAWTETGRISTILQDGTHKRFFIKMTNEPYGKEMIEGECKANSEIYKTLPTFMPKQHGWGKFKHEKPDKYFLLMDFVDMSNELPDPAEFCAHLAELHAKSESPVPGKFGFYMPTHHGRLPQLLDWDSSWESFFRKLLADALRMDRESNGAWPELDAVGARVLEKVLPKLLGPLESEGRTLKPSLIHGDLWEGNQGTCLETGRIYIFDAAGYYAHSEMELGMWRCERHQINSKEFQREYLKNAGVSEPADQFDDRNLLYCVKMNIIHSAHHAQAKERTSAYEDLCYLVGKYDPMEVATEVAQ